MGKDKLRRFAEIETFENVLQLDEGKPFKGAWSVKKFTNDQPLILELACGKGEYTVNLARLFPGTNFIGVDYKGNRIWRGAKTALEEDISNVAFLRIQIENILDYFGDSPRFLEKYKQILKPGGIMHLKTDNDGLHAYTLEKIEELSLKLLARTEDLYHSDLVDDVLSIKTYYEKKYLATEKNINYLKFSF